MSHRSLSRRKFVAALASAAGAGVFAPAHGNLFAQIGAPAIVVGDKNRPGVPCGVMSGDVTSDSAVVLVGKFVFDSNAAMYGGIALLVAASAWNAWRVRNKDAGCPACISDASSTVSFQKEVSS